MKFISITLAGVAVWLGMFGLAEATPSISGYWKLTGNSRAAPPSLTGYGKGLAAKARSDGDVDPQAVRWCVQQGMPFVMDRAGPLDFIQAPDEIVVMGEKTALPRHLYTGGRPHPDESTFDNTPMGNTQAHWRGGTLWADTVGFSEGPGPAGIPRTETGHLRERFIVAGDTMKIISTWSDKKALTKPYTYTLTYRRLPPSYTPTEHYCDPRANGVGH